MAPPLSSDSPLVYPFYILFLSSTASHSARCYTSHLVATFIISMASLLLSNWGSPTPSNNIMKILKKTNFPHPHYQRGSTNCGIAILEGVFIGDTVTLLGILHWDTLLTLVMVFFRDDGLFWDMIASEIVRALRDDIDLVLRTHTEA